MVDASFVISNIIVHILMFCLFLGGFSAIFNDRRGIGKEFVEGINTIGPIFLPIAGVMAAVPFMASAIRIIIGPIFSAIGADPSIAGTTIISTDMGGYQLAYELARSYEDWMMATAVGEMSGVTFSFTIPIGLLLLDKSDHKYFTLGILSGLLGMPFGVFAASALMSFTTPNIRHIVSADAPSDYTLHLSFKTIGMNIWPLIVFTLIIVLCLWYFTKTALKGFIWFGWILNALIKLVFMAAVIELITGGSLSYIFRGWGFDPIIADKEQPLRALEVTALISMVLAGGYPLIYLLKEYASNPISKAGRKIGMDSAGTLGLLASSASVLVMFLLYKDMKPRDKVLNGAFSVCAAFLIGDHLAYNLGVQPGVTIELFVGKLVGGIMGVVIGHFICKKKLHLLQEEVAITTEEAQEDKTLWEMIVNVYNRRKRIAPIGNTEPREYSEFADQTEVEMPDVEDNNNIPDIVNKK